MGHPPQWEAFYNGIVVREKNKKSKAGIESKGSKTLDGRGFQRIGRVLTGIEGFRVDFARWLAGR
jgi:hypothetical protein